MGSEMNRLTCGHTAGNSDDIRSLVGGAAALLFGDGAPQNDQENAGPGSSVDVHVGECLRARREVVGFTEEDLSGRLGLTVQELRAFEEGSARIAAGRLGAFAEALGVPVSFLFDGFSA